MSPAPHPPDPLDRAVFALRTAETPAGPGPDVLSRTLAALEAAEARPIASPQPRKRPMLSTLTRIAAVVMALAGGAAYVASVRPASAAVLLQEVARKLHDARTLSYRQVITLPGSPPLETRVFYREPGQSRTEMPAGVVLIDDTTRGESLILNPASKSATLMRGGSKQDEAQAIESGGLAMMRALRDLAPREGKAIETKTRAGVTVQGYAIRVEDVEMTLWVDPKAQVPVEVQVPMPVAGDLARVTMTDFALNPAVTDAQFSLVVPEGYQVATDDSGDIEPADAVALVLRKLVARNGNQFPATFEDIAAGRALVEEARKVPGPDNHPDKLRLYGSLGVVSSFRFTLPDRHYRPEGAKPGDPDRVVFWYPIEGTAKFRAVFADFHVAEVDATRLPK